MKKERYFLSGMVALFLISIIGFVGCEHEPKYNYEWVFKNQSRYTIQVDIHSEYNVNPRSLSLKPRTAKTVGSNTNYSTILFDYRRTDNGDITGIIWDDYSKTFYDQ